MSRTSVGDVYQKVINDVCEGSRDDFEKGGVDLGTLDLLKAKWQEKLSSFKVAHLPWDLPPPAPVSTSLGHGLAGNARVPPSHTLPSNGNPIATPPSSSSTPGPSIKHESAPGPPTQSNVPYPIPVQHLPNARLTAPQRAAVHLQNSYGMQAGPQIAQLQQGNLSRSQMPQASPLVKEEDQKPVLSSLPDYPAVSHHPVTTIKSSQHDGAGDALSEWHAEAASRRLASQQMMRDYVLESQIAMEGGGSLLPLDENLRLRQQRRPLRENHDHKRSTLDRAQNDGNIDEEKPDLEEDAINSDLDDPDDAANNDGDEDVDQVMLCTYDKVQRVKNKWKCTLKDGILKVEGTDYVFHKGQGEFEW